jgi:hypothetical protein
VAARLANIEFGDFVGNQHVKGCATLHTPLSLADAAQEFNVSRRSVASAKAVLESGDEQLIRQVDSGKVTAGGTFDEDAFFPAQPARSGQVTIRSARTGRSRRGWA